MDSEIIERIKSIKERRESLKDELSSARANLKSFEKQLEQLEDELQDKFGINLSEAEDFLQQKKAEVEEMISQAEEKLANIQVD